MQEEVAGGLRKQPGDDRTDDLAEAEGRRHQRQDPAWRLRGKLPSALQAERGDGDEGAAKQKPAEQRPNVSAHGDAGGDADHLDEAAQA